MIAVILIVIFVFVTWIAFIPPVDDSAQLAFPAVIGLTAVVIVSATTIIRKLDRLRDEIKDIKKNGSDKSDKPKDDN